MSQPFTKGTTRQWFNIKITLSIMEWSLFASLCGPLDKKWYWTMAESDVNSRFYAPGWWHRQIEAGGRGWERLPKGEFYFIHKISSLRVLVEEAFQWSGPHDANGWISLPMLTWLNSEDRYGLHNQKRPNSINESGYSQLTRRKGRIAGYSMTRPTKIRWLPH